MRGVQEFDSDFPESNCVLGKGRNVDHYGRELVRAIPMEEVVLQDGGSKWKLLADGRQVAKSKRRAAKYSIGDTPWVITEAEATYDEDGYDEHGYDQFGRDADGYGRPITTHFDYRGEFQEAYDAQGFDRDGYDIDGEKKAARVSVNEPRNEE